MFKFFKEKKNKVLNDKDFKKIVWVSDFIPKQIILKLKQSKLEFSKIKVITQQKVCEGQILATDSHNSYYLLAPLFGEVIRIDEEKIIIKNTTNSLFAHANNEQIEKIKNTDNWKNIINQLKNKGVYGLGGGCFPAYKKIKLNPEFLIINIMQSEINNYSDFASIIKNINTLKTILLFLKKTINPNHFKIALNEKLYQYPILKKLFQELSNEFEVNIIQNNIIYGSEKVLIKYYQDLYPNTKMSIANTLCFNISTCIAIYDTLKNNKILNKRWISIYDERFKQLYLINVYYGSAIEDILQHINIVAKNNIEMIDGGDMMGSQINTLNTAIQFDNYSFIIKNKQQANFKKNQCINCLKCNDICPVKLEPSILYKSINMNLETNIDKCIECGMCSYVCPSKIELSNLFIEKKSEKNLSQKIENQKKNNELKFKLKSKKINLKNKVLGRKKFTKRVKSNLIAIDNISKEISLIKIQIKMIESNINLAKDELIKESLNQSKQKLLTRLNKLEKKRIRVD